MKKIHFYIILLSTIILSLNLTSCNDYLEIVPKGKKIPTTIADFEALILNEYTVHRVDVTQANILLNDRYVSNSNLSYYPLYGANYNWDESANRIELNYSDEGAYYNNYSAISSLNLIIENALIATEGTTDKKTEVWAQAKVLRAMAYFNLCNYYADSYESSTATSKLSVPLITSSIINAPSEQVSIQAIYDFILGDLNEVLPYLPKSSETVLHPNLGTAFAFYARVYLQMSNYTDALTFVNKALAEKAELYDWVDFYNTNKALIDDANSYAAMASPMGFDYSENYNFRHGSVSYATSEKSILVKRAARFEQGDVKFMARWKIQTIGADTYYKSTLSGYFNYGGITTTEVYLIKAECLARSGDLDGAMEELNTVRRKRILSDVYSDLSAANVDEAMRHIMKTKSNELILSIVPFCDARRLNIEGKYNTILSKEVNGEIISLSPDSHLWTMPFPNGAVSNPGNGSIIQNVER